MAVHTRPSPLRSVLVGAAAGVAGSLAMTAFNHMLDSTVFPPQDRRGRELTHQGSRPDVFEKKEQGGSPARPATEHTAEAAAGPLSMRKRERNAKAIHIGFGAAMGAAYGLAALALPKRNLATALGFGAAVWLASVEVALPALGWSKPPQDYPPRLHAMSLAAHFVFGATTELVMEAADRAA